MMLETFMDLKQNVLFLFHSNFPVVLEVLCGWTFQVRSFGIQDNWFPLYFCLSDMVCLVIASGERESYIFTHYLNSLLQQLHIEIMCNFPHPTGQEYGFMPIQDNGKVCFYTQDRRTEFKWPLLFTSIYHIETISRIFPWFSSGWINTHLILHCPYVTKLKLLLELRTHASSECRGISNAKNLWCWISAPELEDSSPALYMIHCGVSVFLEVLIGGIFIGV